jgi:hypothetical protein
MKHSDSQRIGAKPVLKSGGRWPCLTLHEPPDLEPTLKLDGPEAMRDLRAHLEQVLDEFGGVEGHDYGQNVTAKARSVEPSTAAALISTPSGLFQLIDSKRPRVCPYFSLEISRLETHR